MALDVAAQHQRLPAAENGQPGPTSGSLKNGLGFLPPAGAVQVSASPLHGQHSSLPGKLSGADDGTRVEVPARLVHAELPSGQPPPPPNSFASGFAAFFAPITSLFAPPQGSRERCFSRDGGPWVEGMPMGGPAAAPVPQRALEEWSAGRPVEGGSGSGGASCSVTAPMRAAAGVLATQQDVLVQLAHFTDIDFAFIGWYRLRVSLHVGSGKGAPAAPLIAHARRGSRAPAERRHPGGADTLGLGWTECADPEGGRYEYVSRWLAAPLVDVSELLDEALLFRARLRDTPVDEPTVEAARRVGAEWLAPPPSLVLHVVCEGVDDPEAAAMLYEASAHATPHAPPPDDPEPARCSTPHALPPPPTLRPASSRASPSPTLALFHAHPGATPRLRPGRRRSRRRCG